MYGYKTNIQSSMQWRGIKNFISHLKQRYFFKILTSSIKTIRPNLTNTVLQMSNVAGKPRVKLNIVFMKNIFLF